MSKNVLLLLLLVFSVQVFSQNIINDKIILVSGDTVNCKIIRLNENNIHVVHEKHSNIMLKVISKILTNNVSFTNRLSKKFSSIIITENRDHIVLDLSKIIVPAYIPQSKEKLYDISFSLFSSSSFYSRLGLDISLRFPKINLFQINLGYSAGIREGYEVFYNDNIFLSLGLFYKSTNFSPNIKLTYKRVYVNNNQFLHFSENLLIVELGGRIYPLIKKKYFVTLEYMYNLLDIEIAKANEFNGMKVGLGFHL